jgi:hypothetical protein
MDFELTPEQEQKYQEWEDTLPIDYSKAITFHFTITGIGTVVKVSRDDGYELDLTEWENW